MDRSVIITSRGRPICAEIKANEELRKLDEWPLRSDQAEVAGSWAVNILSINYTASRFGTSGIDRQITSKISRKPAGGVSYQLALNPLNWQSRFPMIHSDLVHYFRRHCQDL